MGNDLIPGRQCARIDDAKLAPSGAQVSMSRADIVGAPGRLRTVLTAEADIINNSHVTNTEQVDYQEQKKTDKNANVRGQENYAGGHEREASANQRTERTVSLYFSTFNRYVCMQSVTETKTEQAGVSGKVFGRKDGTWAGKTGACTPSKGVLLHGAERCRSVHSVDDQRFEIATIKDSDNTILDNIKYDDDKQPKTRNHFQLRVRCFRHHGTKGNLATKKTALLPNTNRGGARTPAGYMREIGPSQLTEKEQHEPSSTLFHSVMKLITNCAATYTAQQGASWITHWSAGREATGSIPTTSAPRAAVEWETTQGWRGVNMVGVYRGSVSSHVIVSLCAVCVYSPRRDFKFVQSDATFGNHTITQNRIAQIGRAHV